MSLIYMESSPSLTLTPCTTVVRFDNAALTSATVQVTGNYQNGQDVLNFVNTGGGLGNFNAASGTLTLTGLDTLANYQAALRSVTYRNTSDNPSALLRTVSFQVKAG